MAARKRPRRILLSRRFHLLFTLPLTLAVGFFLFGGATLFQSQTVQLSLEEAGKASAEADGVGAERSVASSSKKLEPDPGLELILRKYGESGSVPSGIVVMDLSRKTIGVLEPDRSFVPASLYKFFVAERLYALRADRKLSFDQRITITPQSAEHDSGTLIWPVGTTVTIQECLTRMIIISDNACGFLLGSLVGWEKADRALQESGYTGTSLKYPMRTTARDVANLLRAVAEGKLIDRASSQELERILFSQRIKTRLPVNLPPGVIGHKTGDLSGLAHDAGIVRAEGRTYVIVTLTGPWTRPAEANPAVAALSRQVYDYILK